MARSRYYSSYRQDQRRDYCLTSIQDWRDYWRPNIATFNAARNMVFNNTWTSTERELNAENQDPSTDLNVLYPYINMRDGEFSFVQPSFELHVEEGAIVDEPMLESLLFWQNHLAAYFSPDQNDYMLSKIYRFELSGGYGSSFTFSDWSSPKSLNLNIKQMCCPDPTLVNYDIRAKESHKGDGMVSSEIHFIDRSWIAKTYGNATAKKIQKGGSICGVSYNPGSDNLDLVAAANVFCKEYKETKMTKLNDGRDVSIDRYKEMCEAAALLGEEDLLPVPIGRMFKREIPSTTCIQITQDVTLLEKKNTIYDGMLPHIYWCGTQELLSTNGNGNGTQEVTLPYIAKAIDSQRALNLMGQVIIKAAMVAETANYIMPEESLPGDDAGIFNWTGNKASRLKTYKATSSKMPGQSLPPPIPFQNAQVSPVYVQMFQELQVLIQSQLAEFDPSKLATNNSNMSGVAIQEGTIAAQVAALPQMKGIVAGLQQSAKLYMHMAPHIYVTPRSLPIRTLDGNREYFTYKPVKSIFMQFAPDDFAIKVNIGTSTNAQQQEAIDTIFKFMQALPSFNAFMDAKGVKPIIKASNIRDKEFLMAEYEEWMKKQQAAQAQNQQPNPAVMQLQLQAQDQQLKASQQELDRQKMILGALEARKKNETVKEGQLLSLITSTMHEDNIREENQVAAMAALEKGVNSAQAMQLQQEEIDERKTSHLFDLATQASDALIKSNEHQMKFEEHQMKKESHAKEMQEAHDFEQSDEGKSNNNV